MHHPGERAATTRIIRAAYLYYKILRGCLDMAYRNPNRTRIGRQSDTIFQYGGQTATLRSYISASAGVSVAGFGSTLYYRERTITALFAPLPANPKRRRPPGCWLPTSSR